MEENTHAALASATRAGRVARPGKHMTFQLGDEIYGVPILEVREIIRYMEITRVPRAPAFVRGVINLRGRVIPVVDLRLQFDMAPCAATGQTVIIVVQCATPERTLTMGVLVDQVLEVLDIPADQIEPTPDLGDVDRHSEFVLGIGKAGARVVFLLDIARVLSPRDAAAVADTVAPRDASPLVA